MSDTDPTGRPADAEPVTPDPDQAVPNAPDGWAAPPAPSEPAPDAAPAPSEPTAATEPEPDAEHAPDPAESATPIPPATAVGTSDGGGAGDGDRRTRRRLVAACAALFVLSVALAVLAALLASKLESERNRHDAVEEVAGRFATALLTYDHEHLDEAKQRVLALSTGKFRREYEQAFTAGLDVLIRETKATSSGTVTDVFVGGVEQDTASAIVVANAVSEGTTGTRRSVASYIQLELVRVSGAWRVDGVTNLNFGQNDQAQGAPAAPTTTTSAPPG